MGQLPKTVNKAKDVGDSKSVKIQDHVPGATLLRKHSRDL